MLNLYLWRRCWLMDRIGLFLCRCGSNIGKIVDIDTVREHFSQFDFMALDSNDILCSPEGKEWLKNYIKEKSLNRVVIAGCSPKEHEGTFRRILQEAGLNPFMLQMANIREQCEWVSDEPKSATQKAISLVNAAISRVKYNEEIVLKEYESNPDVIILGSGVAGLSAALNIAQKNRKVYLIEKEFVLGGTVALLDELAPGFECASCFLEPAIDKCLHHEDITVLTGTELLEIKGSYGNFNVKVRQKARYILEDACIGCKSCNEVCPVETVDEFSFIPSKKRKAIYIPYEGCLPHISVLDIESCLTNEEDCSACLDTCPFGAINFRMKDEIKEIRCGAILIATGAQIKPRLTAKARINVFNQFQFERIIHPNGPTKGKILKENGEEPKEIVFVLDKSGEKEKIFALKEFIKLAVRSLHIKPDLNPTIVVPLNPEDFDLPDMERLPKEKVDFIKGIGIEIKEYKNGYEIEVATTSKTMTVKSEMVVVYEGYEPSEGTMNLIEKLGLKCNENNFIEEWAGKFEPSSTFVAGIYVAGTACGFKDVKSSIKDGISAGGRILSKLIPGEKLQVDFYAANINEKKCSACGICLSVCPYNAIEKDEETKRAKVLETFCKGCGTCAASCPSEAIVAGHFRTIQIIKEIEGLLLNEGMVK